MGKSMTVDEILEELQRRYDNNKSTLQPDDITVQMVAEKIGKTRETAHTFLEGEVTAGHMEKTVRINKGHILHVYRVI